MIFHYFVVQSDGRRVDKHRFPNLTWIRVRNTNEHLSSAMFYVLQNSSCEQDQILQLNKKLTIMNLYGLKPTGLFPLLHYLQMNVFYFYFNVYSTILLCTNQPLLYCTTSTHTYHYIYLPLLMFKVFVDIMIVISH
jgi:hypothetical protein